MEDISRPWALIVTGPSSAGKTAFARELHHQIAEPAYLFVADECFPVGPTTQVRQDDRPDLEPAIVIFHRALRVWAESGRNVIVDGALPYGDESLRSACLNELRPFDVHAIAITCSIEQLRRRERARPDGRLLGWAETQYRDIDAGLELELVVDTTETSPAAAASYAVDALSRNGVLH